MNQYIYYNCSEFKDYLYPFEDKEILNELFNNTIFLPFHDNNKSFGLTEKLIGKVFIGSNFKGEFKIEP